MKHEAKGKEEKTIKPQTHKMKLIFNNFFFCRKIVAKVGVEWSRRGKDRKRRILREAENVEGSQLIK